LTQIFFKKNYLVFLTLLIAVARPYKAILIPATVTHKICMQLHLIGNPESVNTEISWMSSIHKGTVTHAVMFTIPQQFQFNTLVDHIQERIRKLRQSSPLDNFGSDLASGG